MSEFKNKWGFTKKSFKRKVVKKASSSSTSSSKELAEARQGYIF